MIEKEKVHQFVIDTLSEKMFITREIITELGSLSNVESQSIELVHKLQLQDDNKNIRIVLSHLLYYCLNDIADIDNKVEYILDNLETTYSIGIFTHYNITPLDLTFAED